MAQMSVLQRLIIRMMKGVGKNQTIESTTTTAKQKKHEQDLGSKSIKYSIRYFHIYSFDMFAFQRCSLTTDFSQPDV